MVKVYTVPEVAEILHTNNAYVYRLFDAGRLKPIKIGRMKVREEELKRFLEEYEGFDVTDPRNPERIKNEEG